ncbi:hypothetical protein JW899_04525 [Candidatus Uhrbacteria bacterium]|nr:hypothetical protein [Candidatus Uhrbacteria bacterium]
MPKNDKPTGIIDTITASWLNLIKNIRVYLNFTAVSVFLGLALWLLKLVTQDLATGRMASVAVTVAVSVPFTLAFMVLTLGLIIATWTGLGKKRPDFRESVVSGAKMLKSFVWLSVLTGLAFMAAPITVLISSFTAAVMAAPILSQNPWLYVLAAGAMATLTGLVIAIPAYYALPLSFIANHLSIDGIKGWSCLKRASGLVRGRWWRTLWRLSVPSLFFWLAVQLALKLVGILTGMAFGDSESVWYASLGLVISQSIYGLSYPLFVGTNLMVWNDLKRLEGRE